MGHFKNLNFTEHTAFIFVNFLGLHYLIVVGPFFEGTEPCHLLSQNNPPDQRGANN